MGDLGAVAVEAVGEDLWLVWNERYGAHTDSGDMGCIMRKGDSFEAMSRGDMPRSLGVFASLEAAKAALIAAY